MPPRRPKVPVDFSVPDVVLGIRLAIALRGGARENRKYTTCFGKKATPVKALFSRFAGVIY